MEKMKLNGLGKQKPEVKKIILDACIQGGVLVKSRL